MAAWSGPHLLTRWFAECIDFTLLEGFLDDFPDLRSGRNQSVRHLGFPISGNARKTQHWRETIASFLSF
jgi:hypothetical protein